MSTTPIPGETSSAPLPAPGRREIRVYSHSALFYWWPVWACGFLMAILTFIDGYRMALVPSDTLAFRHADVTATIEGKETTLKDVEAIMVRKGHLPPLAKDDLDKPPEQPHIFMS